MTTLCLEYLIPTFNILCLFCLKFDSKSSFNGSFNTSYWYHTVGTIRHLMQEESANINYTLQPYLVVVDIMVFSCFGNSCQEVLLQRSILTDNPSKHRFHSQLASRKTDQLNEFFTLNINVFQTGGQKTAWTMKTSCWQIVQQSQMKQLYALLQCNVHWM